MKKITEWEHGKVLKSTSFAGYNFTETAYSSKFDLSAHSHNFVYFCFVLQGNFKEVYGKREKIYNPLTLIFHPLKEIHSNHFYTKSRCFNIQFNLKKLQQIDSSQRLLETTKAFENGEIINLVSKIYKELCFIDKYSTLTIEGLMLEILAETLRKSENMIDKKPPRWLLHIKSLIEEEFAENLTTDLLAKTESVHPTHLAREFRRYFKTTIGDYVRRKRLELACQKLVNSNTPINEIALETGFFDQSHFTRVFKKTTGTTPLIYRKLFSSS